MFKQLIVNNFVYFLTIFRFFVYFQKAPEKYRELVKFAFIQLCQMFNLKENLVRKYHLSGLKFGLTQRTNNFKRNWIFTTNFNFPIPLSLQPDDLNL